MTQPKRPPGLEALRTKRSAPEPPPDLHTVAELLSASGHPVRLKILYLLHHKAQLNVSQLAEALETSIATASRHLTLLRTLRLLEPRRDAQAVYYRLTDHPFHEVLRTSLFDAATDDSRARDAGRGRPAGSSSTTSTGSTSPGGSTAASPTGALSADLGGG